MSGTDSAYAATYAADIRGVQYWGCVSGRRSAQMRGVRHAQTHTVLAHARHARGPTLTYATHVVRAGPSTHA
eukprot:1167575-Rhodomonas_salina.2